MTNGIWRQVVSETKALGPLVLLQGHRIERPKDVVRARSLTVDDKRAILAAWASDLYAVDSKPALRLLLGTQAPVSIDEIEVALKELDRRFCC